MTRRPFSLPNTSFPWQAGVTILLGILAYANVLNGPFLFDDPNFIVRNRFLDSFRHWPALFTSSPSAGAGLTDDNFYRPLQMTAFMVLSVLFGKTPLPFHVLSLAVHITNALLLNRFLRRLGLARGAFPASLIFLLHPVQTEAVSYVSGLGDPLSLLFVLSALLSLCRFFDDSAPWPLTKTAVAVTAATVAALLAKEIGVIAAPLVVATIVVFQKRFPEKAAVLMRTVVPGVLVLTGVYLVLKFTLFSFTGVAGLTAENNPYTSSLSVRLTTFVNILWDYARLLVWPAGLNYEKPYTAYPLLLTPRGLFGLAVLSASVAAAALSFSRRRIVFLSAVWFWAGLAPVSGVVAMNAMYLEHWLYAPLAGLCVGAAAAWEALDGRNRKIAAALSSAVLVACVVRTHARNEQWSDPEAFYLNELRSSERPSARVLNNLALVYTETHRPAQAVPYLERSVRLRSDAPLPHHNLGVAYWSTGRPQEAVEELFAALSLQPNLSYSVEALIRIYQAAGEPACAVRLRRYGDEIRDGAPMTREDVDGLRRDLIVLGRNPAKAESNGPSAN